MDDDLQQKIDEALGKGIPMADIAKHLASHSNADWQNYGRSWLESASSEPTRKSDFASQPATATGMLDWIQENPKTAAAAALGTYAVMKAPAIIGGIQDRNIRKKELELKERSLAAYEKQVERQGMTNIAPEEVVKMAKQASVDIPEPLIAEPEPKLTPQQVVERNRAAGIGQTTVPGGVAPAAAPAPVSAPVAPQPVAQTPATATEAVATGQSPSKAIQMDVAQQLDAASAEPEIKGAVKPKGRPAGAKNLTPEQKSMIKVGEQAAGGRNWLVNQFGADPAAYEKYIAQFNKGMDYPDYKTAVTSLSENLEGPPKQAFKKAVKPPSSQAGFVNVSAPTQLTPLGQGVANVGRQVVGDLKMGAAMVPFMLSTDVRQQDVGYKRELQNQLKQEKDPARAQTLKNELDKLEEGRYLQAMYNRFVQKNTMQQYRPALTR